IRPIATLDDGRRVMLDDNTTPVLAFIWAAGHSAPGPDIQINHLSIDSKNPDTYSALWNLCVTPSFLAKTTDGQNHPKVREALTYRAFELYEMPDASKAPSRPDGYEALHWAPMPKPALDLESLYRSRLALRPKSPPAQAARQIGWLFSGGQPDFHSTG